MNYLAHLYLADNTAHSLLGNLMADFVKGKLDDNYPPELLKGIKLHRQVDKYTDNHDIFRLSKKRVRKDLSRYAGILIDVYYDHFLATNWELYSQTSLNHQLDIWLDTLDTNYEFEIPEKLEIVLETLQKDKWILNYKNLDGIEKALVRISQRIRFKNNLSSGIHDLKDNYDELNKDFKCFFPQLLAFVQNSA